MRMGLVCKWRVTTGEWQERREGRDGVCSSGCFLFTSTIYQSTGQSSLVHFPDNGLIWVLRSRLDHIGVAIGNNHTLLAHRKQHKQD